MIFFVGLSPSCHHQFKIFFGASLCGQLSEAGAPKLMIKICQQLEKLAQEDLRLSLYNLYCTPTPVEELSRFAKAIDENLGEVDVTEASAVLLTGILKKYLRELPDPLIPVQWYDKFLETASELTSFRDNSCVFLFSFLFSVKTLPELPQQEGRKETVLLKKIVIIIIILLIL